MDCTAASEQKAAARPPFLLLSRIRIHGGLLPHAPIQALAESFPPPSIAPSDRWGPESVASRCRHTQRLLVAPRTSNKPAPHRCSTYLFGIRLVEQDQWAVRQKWLRVQSSGWCRLADGHQPFKKLREVSVWKTQKIRSFPSHVGPKVGKIRKRLQRHLRLTLSLRSLSAQPVRVAAKQAGCCWDPSRQHGEVIAIDR